MRALSLGEGEELYYCVPVDLNFDSREKLAREVYAEKTYLAVTGERFLVLEGEKQVNSPRNWPPPSGWRNVRRSAASTRSRAVL